MAIVDIFSATLTPIADWLTEFVAAHPVVATLITVGSISSSIWTNHKNRAATVFGHSMQAITHLDQRWESNDLKRHRSIAAAFLMQSNSKPVKEKPQTAEEEAAINAVLNFLETVGCFVRTKAIAPRTAWHLFGSAAQLYVEASAKQLATYRNPHATVYSELQYLYLISRVEEDRHDFPLIWLWLRVSATRLSINAGIGKKKSFSYLAKYAYQVLYALLLARVHERQNLAALLTKDDVVRSLTRESRLATGTSAQEIN